MYGVLLDSIFEVMRDQFDADQWAEIQRLANDVTDTETGQWCHRSSSAQIQRLASYQCDNDINEFQSYSDTLIHRLTSAAHAVTGISPEQVRHHFISSLCIIDCTSFCFFLAKENRLHLVRCAAVFLTLVLVGTIQCVTLILWAVVHIILHGMSWNKN